MTFHTGSCRISNDLGVKRSENLKRYKFRNTDIHMPVIYSNTYWAHVFRIKARETKLS